jgi:hypothetical protein
MVSLVDYKKCTVRFAVIFYLKYGEYNPVAVKKGGGINLKEAAC